MRNSDHMLLYAAIVLAFVFMGTGCQNEEDALSETAGFFADFMEDIGAAAECASINDRQIAEMIREKWYTEDFIAEWNDKSYVKINTGVMLMLSYDEFYEKNVLKVGEPLKEKDFVLRETNIAEAPYERILSCEIGVLECLFVFADVDDESAYELYAGISERDLEPELLETVQYIEELIPEYWVLKDFCEGDFNSDGIADVVGILEKENAAYGSYPRIVFTAFGTGSGYVTDLCDYTFLPRKEAGGPYGEDMYKKIVPAGDDAFTVVLEGAFGSSTRFSQTNYTFTYSGSEWELTELIRKEWEGTRRYMDIHQNYIDRISTRRYWDTRTPYPDEVLPDEELPEANLTYSVGIDGPVSMGESPAVWDIIQKNEDSVMWQDKEIAAESDKKEASIVSRNLEENEEELLFSAAHTDYDSAESIDVSFMMECDELIVMVETDTETRGGAWKYYYRIDLHTGEETYIGKLDYWRD